MSDYESRKARHNRIQEILILGNFGSRVPRNDNESSADFKERARQAYLNDTLFHHAVDYQLSAIMEVLESEQ